VPYISEMAEWGPFVFAGILLVTFVVLGYIYDRVFVLWAPSHEVTQERNPFQYVARPIDKIFWLPTYSALLDSCKKLADHFDIDSTVIDETREYYAAYERFRPERREDIDEAIRLREEYFAKHSLAEIGSESEVDDMTSRG
jgi:hypothetical protein